MGDYTALGYSYFAALRAITAALLAYAVAMLSPTYGQFTVSVEQPVTEFTVTVEPTEIIKPKRREWYLVSEPWCSNCPAAKQKFLAKGWPAANILTIAECESRFRFRPDHVPFEFGEPVATKTVVRSEPVSVAMSHSEMVALHNRLHGGGQWTWPGDLASHLQATHGVSTVKQSSPVQQSTIRYQQQSACPGGRCPTPSRRRGVFGIFQ